MKKIRVMIVGYGNVGRGVRLSLGKNPDMELVGIVSRSPERVGKELPDVPVMAISDVEGWKKAFRPDVAILCGGSKNDLPQQGPEFAKYVNTVDSFDNHSRIPEYFADIDAAAKASGHVSVISTGWDPGIFSLERVLGGAFIPGARAFRTVWRERAYSRVSSFSEGSFWPGFMVPERICSFRASIRV